MKKKVRKDSSIRQNYLTIEKTKFILSYSANSSLFLTFVRDELYNQISLIPTNFLLTRSVSRCILTGRRKRLNKWFSFSRLVVLRLYRSRLLIQLRKLK